MGGCQEDGDQTLLTGVQRQHMGQQPQLKHRKFHLNMRKNSFAERVTKPWNGLPTEAVESPSLEPNKLTFRQESDSEA